MKKRFILFDFDGVVVDSFKPAFETQRMMCPHLTEEGYRARFEGNINDWPRLEEPHTKECRLDMDFFAEYTPRIKKEVTLVQGMDRVITELQKDHTLIVISSNVSLPIRELLEVHALDFHFTEIMGNDVHKSKVEKIKMVFSKYGATSQTCVFITDTLGDMREAAHMDVGSIGVSWGFHGKDRLVQGNPFHIAEHPGEIVGAVSDYFAR